MVVAKQKKSRKCSELLSRWNLYSSAHQGMKWLWRQAKRTEVCQGRLLDFRFTQVHGRCHSQKWHIYGLQKNNLIYWAPLPLLIFGAIIKYLHKIQASMISVTYLLFLWWRTLRFCLINTAVRDIPGHFLFLQCFWQTLEQKLLGQRVKNTFCDSLYTTKILLTMAVAYYSYQWGTIW